VASHWYFEMERQMLNLAGVVGINDVVLMHDGFLSSKPIDIKWIQNAIRNELQINVTFSCEKLTEKHVKPC
jgi:hypothetical protein